MRKTMSKVYQLWVESFWCMLLAAFGILTFATLLGLGCILILTAVTEFPIGEVTYMVIKQVHAWSDWWFGRS